MSFNKSKKKPFLKKVEKGISPKLLKTLQRLISHQSGSVSYVFNSGRTENIYTDEKGWHDVPVKGGILYAPVTAQALQGEKPGTIKSPEEILDMFHSIKHDIGASYFIVD